MSRKIAGYKARAHGKGDEDQLAFLHQLYHAHDLAYVEHNGTMAEMRGGQWVPQKSKGDYSGMITCERARFVGFDNKHVDSGNHYYHPENKAHQCQWLYEVERSKGVAFLLVLIKEQERAWAIWPQRNWVLDGYSWGLTLQDGIDPGIAVPVPAFDRVKPEYVPDWLQIAIPRIMDIEHFNDPDWHVRLNTLE